MLQQLSFAPQPCFFSWASSALKMFRFFAVPGSELLYALKRSSRISQRVDGGTTFKLRLLIF